MITNEIGINAGKIWHYLNENKEVKVKELKKILKFNEQELNLAIGWLSREGKLFHYFDDDNSWIICLTEK
ncbi:MAG: winged helix-turn-helix domain-containing protein [Bacteroidota bacterium]|nr:winged helix-turn-helix domain-containing protein [Bacteroidota bacterium]